MVLQVTLRGCHYTKPSVKVTDRPLPIFFPPQLLGLLHPCLPFVMWTEVSALAFQIYQEKEIKTSENQQHGAYWESDSHE